GGQPLADSAGASFTSQPQPGLAIFSLGPPAAPAGNPVVVDGAGFSAVPGQNLVFFKGVLAPVVSATPTALIVRVPSGAKSGDVTVRVGAVTSLPRPFTVLAPGTPTFTVSGTIPLIKGIHDVAVTPDGRRAYITNPFTNSVSAVSVTQLTTKAIIPVGLAPQSIRILPDGSRA